MEIIIKGKDNVVGKTRSEIEKNIRSAWGTQSMSDEKLDRLKYAERKYREKTGASKNFIDQHIVDRVK